MNTKDIFSEVLFVVSNVTDIPRDIILSQSRREDIVDARHLLIYFLHAKGVYIVQISSITAISMRHIAYILSNFDGRVKTRRLLRMNYDIIKTKLADN